MPRIHFPLLAFPQPPSPCAAPDLEPVPAAAVVAKKPPARRNRKMNFGASHLADYLVNPVDLGFIPLGHWASATVPLSTIVAEFFRARSSRILRFEYKLWNALALAKHYPDLYQFVGVMWLTQTVLKVNRDVFGHFINVTRPAAALYNNQGSFATHGFQEVALKDVQGTVDPEDLSDVDESIVRLFEHTTTLFNVYSTDAQVLCCRYVQSSW
jgi:hypothetical protein